jgi:aspartate 1-decarboxylase
MLCTVLKSKIHHAFVTEAKLNYVGSCTIDMDLVDASNMAINEQVHVLNVNNGERFVTYIIPGERGSGTICLNGACARLAQVGDKVIIVTYGQIEQRELPDYMPNVIVVDSNNKLKERLSGK